MTSIDKIVRDISVYNIPYGELVGELCGHQQIVYDFDWNKNDELLLSASGDGTAQFVFLTGIIIFFK